MAVTTHPQSSNFQPSPDEAIRESLRRIEEQIDHTEEYARTADFFQAIDAEFRQLHARIRAQHAAGFIESRDAGVPVPAEWTHECLRLREEHPRILGQLDWLIRHVESIADQPVEDRDVFILRVRELIAVLRRHEAEDDRIFAIALWNDTGGES